MEGLEALIRWYHPQRGLISPGEFIPVLEQSTLMSEVSTWVLKSVCQQISLWQAQGLNVVPIAVNLSGKDFLVKDLHLNIAAILQEYQIEGQNITLEITETVLATDTQQCISAMKKIKQLGVKFAIDDFGAGYSSMSYLKRFPIDTLKIDRAFVKNCDTDHEEAAICTAIIALGKSLGLQIVAEGVE